MAVRRGQVFVVGALLFGAMIVSLFLVATGGGLQDAGPETPRFLFKWGMDEYPRVVNLAAAENDSARHLRNRITSYLQFQRYVVERRGATMTAHSLVTVPNGTDTNAVLTNARGAAMEDTTLSVAGTEKSIGSLPAGDTRILTFSDTPSQFRVNLSFTDGKDFDHRETWSGQRITALYRLKIEAAQQTWVDTRTY
ncbi:MAG: hypothetical protein SVW02_00490 [Candidatus Nanohaloarchaea archaeon]|nr:hypothetical protein [Candidatus Nanohaloarchaea archaeon]